MNSLNYNKHSRNKTGGNCQALSPTELKKAVLLAHNIKIEKDETDGTENDIDADNKMIEEYIDIKLTDANGVSTSHKILLWAYEDFLDEQIANLKF
ncbi:hypothetical protein IKB17_06790 [bacterium]|nr:hypothetical protein [bacterium]